MSAFLLRAAAIAVLLGAASAPVLADDTGFAYSHDLRREAGKRCMTDHYHYGSGSGPNRKAAERSAISSWAGFTDFEYGSDWARWSRAASKGISCSGGSGGVTCQVQARPCK